MGTRFFGCLILVLSPTYCYYLIPDGQKLNWYSAEEYCVNHCNSHLASVHSDEDFNSIKTLMSNDNIIDNNDNAGSIWIGLKHNDINGNWEYTDNTIFDFGNNINKSTRTIDYPWRDIAPDIEYNDNADCVRFVEGCCKYYWDNIGCKNRYELVVCNDCDDIIINQTNNINTTLTATETFINTTWIPSTTSYNDITVYKYGIYINIIFEYTLLTNNTNNVSLIQKLKDITQNVISNEIEYTIVFNENDADCVLYNEYDININSIYNKSNTLLINSTILICNEITKNQLSTQFNSSLRTDFINAIESNITFLILIANSTNINIETECINCDTSREITEYTTTYIGETEQIVDDYNNDDDKTMVYVMIFIGIGCILVVIFLIFVWCRIYSNKKNDTHHVHTGNTDGDDDIAIVSKDNNVNSIKDKIVSSIQLTKHYRSIDGYIYDDDHDILNDLVKDTLNENKENESNEDEQTTEPSLILDTKSIDITLPMLPADTIYDIQNSYTTEEVEDMYVVTTTRQTPYTPGARV